MSNVHIYHPDHGMIFYHREDVRTRDRHYDAGNRTPMWNDLWTVDDDVTTRMNNDHDHLYSKESNR